MSDYPTLRHGSRGEHVRYLQEVYERLFGGGMSIPPDVTGEFDEETDRFTRMIQRRYDLEDDGIVGPKTWRMLEEVAGGPLFQPEEYLTTETVGRGDGDHGRYPTLRQGASGEWVEYLQTLLAGQLTGGVRVTGHFGPDTDDAVRTFQQGTNLHIDGIVGEDTWHMLETYTSQDNPPAVEMEADRVEYTQPEPPTYQESERGRTMLTPIVESAVHDARWLASKDNEWAMYDGNEAGRDQFIGGVLGGMSFLDGGWVYSWLENVAASTAAYELAVFYDQFDSVFTDAFLAGLRGDDPPSPKNAFLHVFALQAHATAAQIPEEQRAWVLAYLLRMGDADFVLTPDHPKVSWKQWTVSNQGSWARSGMLDVISNTR